jgi:hypothetical protein
MVCFPGRSGYPCISGPASSTCKHSQGAGTVLPEGFSTGSADWSSFATWAQPSRSFRISTPRNLLFIFVSSSTVGAHSIRAWIICSFSLLFCRREVDIFVFASGLFRWIVIKHWTRRTKRRHKKKTFTIYFDNALDLCGHSVRFL